VFLLLFFLYKFYLDTYLFQALKALALLRSGKGSESSKLIEAVRQETPTDDPTLQVLNICYRDLEERKFLTIIDLINPHVDF